MTATGHGTLAANVPATETLDGIIRGWEVFNRSGEGGEALWMTWGFNTAATPTVAGAGTIWIPAGSSFREDDAAWTRRGVTVAVLSTVFKVLAEGVAPYSVHTW